MAKGKRPDTKRGAPITHPMRERPIVYPPVGLCIYCGATAGGGVKLTKEHIVPLGLGGGFILPLASCSSCAAITGSFEQICQRKIFGAYRKHLGLKSNRRKDDHEYAILHLQNLDGTVSERLVHISSYPRYLVLPKFPEPGIMRGVPDAPLTATFEIHGDMPQINKIAAMQGGQPMLNTYFDLMAFARMVAKIGYAFAVAEVGWKNIEPVADDFILGKDPEAAGAVVGQMYYPIARRSGSMHWIATRYIQHAETIYVIASIQLFCEFSPFVYSVVAGKLKPTPEFFTRRDNNNLGADFIAYLKKHHARPG